MKKLKYEKTQKQKDYEKYLKSPEWESTKKRYWHSERPKQCFVCGRNQYVLHHTSYKGVPQGNESLDDLIPLCDGHHKEVHSYFQCKKYQLSDSLEILWKIKQKVEKSAKTNDYYTGKQEPPISETRLAKEIELICGELGILVEKDLAEYGFINHITLSFRDSWDESIIPIYYNCFHNFYSIVNGTTGEVETNNELLELIKSLMVRKI